MSISFNFNLLGPTAKDTCEDFDRLKLYQVSHVGNIYTIKRIKFSNVSLDTLKKMTDLINQGQIWIKRGSKREGRKFIGQNILTESIRKIIVDKSDNKDGSRLNSEINVDLVDFANMNQEDLQRLNAISQGLANVIVKNDTLEKSRTKTTSEKVHQPVVEVVSRNRLEQPIISTVKNNELQLKELQVEQQILEQETTAHSRKTKRRAQKESKELDEKADRIRREDIKKAEKSAGIQTEDVKKVEETSTLKKAKQKKVKQKSKSLKNVIV